MGTVSSFPVVRHYRGEPSTHVVRYRGGAPAAAGRGLTFWFVPLDTAIAEVPLDDRDVTFLFHGSTSDFQDVTVQGVITFRVSDADLLATRVDFGVDLWTGNYLNEPLDHITGVLTNLAQQIAFGWMTKRTLADALAEGTAPLRREITTGLRDDPGLADTGLAIVAVRVAAISPSAEMEKALQTPARERIQQDADEAIFERRALAVDKERAIAENELANRIELTRREETLLKQQGSNERLRVGEEAEAKRIETEARTARDTLRAEAQAAGIRLVETAKADGEAAHADVYRTMPADVLMALAMRDFAGKVEKIEHLSITPELLTPLLGGFLQAATKRLDG